MNYSSVWGSFHSPRLPSFYLSMTLDPTWFQFIESLFWCLWKEHLMLLVSFPLIYPITTIKNRHTKWSKPYSITWHWSGSNRVFSSSPYIVKWKNYIPQFLDSKQITLLYFIKSNLSQDWQDIVFRPCIGDSGTLYDSDSQQTHICWSLCNAEYSWESLYTFLSILLT